MLNDIANMLTPAACVICHIPVTYDIGRLHRGTRQVGSALSHSQHCLPNQLNGWVCCSCRRCGCALYTQPSTGTAEQGAITGSASRCWRLASHYDFSQSLNSCVTGRIRDVVGNDVRV